METLIRLFSHSDGGGGGGTVTHINDIFDGTFFNGEGRNVVNLIENLIAENNLFVCTEDLHRDLYQCIASSVASGETTPHPGHIAPINDTQNNGELSISSYIYELNNIASSSNSCLADVISQYQDSSHDMELGDGSLLCAISENNTSAMTDEEIFDFIQDNDCFDNATGIMDESCVDLLNLANKLELDREELDWLSEDENEDVMQEVRKFLDEHNYDEESRDAARIAIIASQMGTLTDLESIENLSIYESEGTLEQYVDYEESEYIDYENEDCCPNGGAIWEPIIRQILDDHVSAVQTESAVLKKIHPGWSDLTIRLGAEYNVTSGAAHTALDILGLFPGGGEVFDAVNGVFYMLEGDNTNAMLSFAALVPLAGSTGTGSRILKKAISSIPGGITRTVTWKVVNNNIVFSHMASSSYRALWGTPSGMVGHHMVPKHLANHPLVQKAAGSDPLDYPPFHMNMPENGFNLNPSRHSGPHTPYSNEIRQKMDDWNVLNSSATSREAAAALGNWQIQLRELIESSTGHIDNLIIPDIP